MKEGRIHWTNLFGFVPLPTDTSGFLHRVCLYTLGEKQTYDDFSRELKEHLTFVCTEVNAINLYRKTDEHFQFCWDVANDYRNDIFWKEGPQEHYSDNYIFVDLLTIAPIEESFEKLLAKAQLQERDSLLQELAQKLNAATFVSDGEIQIYRAYVEYALSDLLAHWDETELQFLAPIFRYGDFDGTTENTIVSANPDGLIVKPEAYHACDTQRDVVLLGVLEEAEWRICAMRWFINFM